MPFMQKRKHHPARETVFMQWTRPATNWFESKIDGSAIGYPGVAGQWDLIGDANGNWVSRFTRFIDHTTSSAAELWAIGDGMKLVKDLHVTHSETGVDAPLIVLTLLSNFFRIILFPFLFWMILGLSWNISRGLIWHACREGNRCADKLCSERKDAERTILYFVRTSSWCYVSFEPWQSWELYFKT